MGKLLDKLTGGAAKQVLSDRALSDRALSDRALSDSALSDRALSAGWTWRGVAFGGLW